MRWAKLVILALLSTLVLAGAVVALYVQRSLPRLDGELRLTGLTHPVTVQRDAADVTHILAGSAADAWRALGYVHAQERGWQLEFNRRLMRGELSEVLGEATLETDKLLHALGVIRAAQAQWDNLPGRTRAALQAYSDGINAFHTGTDQALPPEFLMLGIQPGAWSPVDSMGWSLMMALDLGGNWGNEFARLSSARVLSTERLWQLFPPYPGEPPASKTDFSQLYADLGLYRRVTSAGTSTKATSDRADQASIFSGLDIRAQVTQALGEWSRATIPPAASPCWPTIRTWA
jgi:penicillin amidase